MKKSKNKEVQALLENARASRKTDLSVTLRKGEKPRIQIKEK